ncbi:hypothetical protein BGZ50_000977, partial [Haplosporangium sp. Z 11]
QRMLRIEYKRILERQSQEQGEHMAVWRHEKTTIDAHSQSIRNFIKAENLGPDKNEGINRLLNFTRERPGVLRRDRSPPTAWMAPKWTPHVLTKQRPSAYHSERSETGKRRRPRTPERSGKVQQAHRTATSTPTPNKSWRDTSPCTDVNCGQLIRKKVIKPHSDSGCFRYNRLALYKEIMVKHKAHLDKKDANAKSTVSHEERSSGARPVKRLASINQKRHLHPDESDDGSMGIDPRDDIKAPDAFRNALSQIDTEVYMTMTNLSLTESFAQRFITSRVCAFRGPLAGDNRYVIPILIQGEEYTALLDPGANVSLIETNVAKELGIRFGKLRGENTVL